MSIARSLALAALLGVGLFTRRSAAHDPFEITSLAVVDGSKLDLRVTMTRAAAERLQQSLHEPPTSTAFAAQLFEIESALETRRATTTSSAYNAEGELEVSLNFGELRAATLRFEATHLRALPEGYLNTLVVRRSNQAAPFARKVLQQSDNGLEVQLPELATIPRGDSRLVLALAALGAVSFAAARWFRDRAALRGADRRSRP